MESPPAAAAVPGGARALRPFGGGLAAAASARPFAQLSKGERTLVTLGRLCAEPPAASVPAGSSAAAAAAPRRLRR